MMRLLSIAVAWLIASAALADSEPFVVPGDGVDLHGTLELPEAGQTPVAIAVIIAGSGPTDRDGNSAVLPGPNNSLRYLAEALAESRIASVRYDKRMVGQSVRPCLKESDLRFDQYADDATRVLTAARERFPAIPALLIGHSEGAHLALTAAPEANPDGVIVIAGPGQHPADLIGSQLSRLSLATDAQNRASAALQQLRAGETVSDVPPQFASLFRPDVQPYLISWFQYDPAVQAAAIDVPLLLVYGDKDIQVPPTDGRVLAEAQPNATLIEIAGMNHMLKQVGDDRGLAQSSYWSPALPLEPQVAEAIVARWGAEPD